MELKDPITNATLTEEQLMAAKLPDATISPSDDENSSIITVRSNVSNNNNNESVVRLHLATEDNENASNVQSGGISGGGSFLTAVQHHQPSNVIDVTESTMQTIVEVVNPLISGQGYANTIAVGGSNDDGSYPSFDPTNDDGNVAEMNYDSLDVYNTASELSLSDKMKNVLQELVKNERVRLSFSQSISEGEDSDSEQNDTDDDANEPLRHDSSDDDESVVPISLVNQATVTEENGNAAAAAAAAAEAAAVIAQLNIVDTVASDSGNNDDIKNANIIDDDFIYKNPNFLMAGDEMDASTSQNQNIVRNERDEKLKEKLLAELNVQPLATIEMGSTFETEKIVNTNDGDAEEESSISIHEEVPLTPTSPTETSSKSDSISSTGTGAGKRKKRKNKGRKK